MNPTRRVSRFTITVSILAALLVAGAAHGQLNEPMESTWVTNGPVFAMESNAAALFLGGNFSYVGPSTGSAVRLHDDGLLAAAPDPVFPKVNGTVYAMISDGADGWYIGGDFTRVGTELRNRIARVLPDGSVDAWNPGVNNTVYTLALSDDGLTLFAGGTFTRIGASDTRRYLAAIDIATATATAWSPWPNDFVRTMTLSTDGLTLYVGGNFTQIGALSRSYLAAFDVDILSPNYGDATAWNPVLDSFVRTMTITPDGSKLFVGGWFSNIGVNPYTHIAAFDAEPLSPNFGQVIAGFTPQINNPVLSLSATDTELYVGGSFTQVNYLERNAVAALDAATGATLPDWSPDANGWVTALAVSTDGVTLYAGGDFTEIGGELRHHLARLDAVGENDGTGRAVLAWDAGAGNSVYVLNPVDEITEEYLYAGGAFTTVNGVVRENLAALDAITGDATTWAPDADNAVYAMAMDAPGVTLFVGGMFTEINATAASRIAALDPNDDSNILWFSTSVDDTVRTLALPPNDSLLYAGGDFTTINGQPRGYLAALNAGSGILSGAWIPNADAPVNAIAATDGVVYAGGEFENIGGQLRNYLAALNISGIATGWTIAADAPVLSLKLTGAPGFDVLYAGGSFTTIGGQARTRLAALDTVGAGAVIPWTDLGLNGTVECTLLDEAKETLWVGGNFVNPRLRLVAVDLDPLHYGDLLAWDPKADNPVYAFSQSDTGGTIYAGGSFATVGGTGFSGGGDSRSYLASFALRPVITLNGAATLDLECNVDTYTELGATAFDAEGTALTVVIGGDVVDTTAVGTYVVTYDATDGSGNPADQVIRTVNVVDTTAPVITLTGTPTITLECVVGTYSELGATATDTCEGDVSGLIVIDATAVNANLVGSYPVTYDVTDSAGNAVQVTRTVDVVDTTPPVITLNDVSPVITDCGFPYVDAGVTVTDDCEGDMSALMVPVSTVNTTAPGSYTVTYDITDAEGNIAATVTRTVNVVDVTGPAITLLGANPQFVECDTVYAELGATATDACEGDVSGAIVIDATAVNTNIIGSYPVTYNVMDSVPNAAVTVTRTVTVVDAMPPVIALNGTNPMTVECNTAYTEPGATALDACEGNLTAAIVIDNTAVDTTSIGSYAVTYNVSDSQSNAAVEVIRTVDVVDATAPVITLLGADPVTLECGDTYTDAGATALDNCEGDLTASIVADTSAVDTGVAGSYTVSYNVTDSAGNAATELLRTVTVSDTIIPLITLLGNVAETIECGDVYADAGATATDSCDGDLTAAIVVNNPVINTVVGSYTITYNVNDGVGNAALEVTRTVNVIDTTAPVITLTGNATEDIECGLGYVDAGAAATDNCDGDISASITTVSTVNDALVGSYTVTYDVTDGAGIAAAQVVRTVNVVDAIAPVITLIGANPVPVECGTAYAELGAAATDACDGDVSGGIVIDAAAVDTGIVGSYPVTYNVSDGTGNAAAEVIRTVDVADTIAPELTLLGDSEILIPQFGVFIDPLYTAVDACDGDLFASVIVGGLVDETTVGPYTLTYEVMDAAGNVSPILTRTVYVTAPGLPHLVRVTVTGSRTIEVEYSNDMDISATDLGAYTISGPGAGFLGINPFSMTVIDPRTYQLEWMCPEIMMNGEDVTITVLPTVQDTLAQPMTEPMSLTHFGGAVAAAPLITLVGADPVTVECGTAYADAGANAVDECGTDLTIMIATMNPVNENVPGTYTVLYNLLDGAANEAVEVTRTVNVVDTTAPTIALQGFPVETAECGVPYVDAGATATDACDGDLTASLVIDNQVDTAIPGAYVVNFDVTDAAGFAAATVTRTVNVVDSTPPVITLIGNATETVECGDAYTDAGATATDACEGAVAVVVGGDVVDTATAGSYVITYDAQDSLLQPAVQVTRTVDVVDTTAPVITLTGSNPITVECGNTYTDAGATATDACDGDLTASIVTVNPVDTGLVGAYTVTYDVTDAATNAATQVTRTVNVVDTTAPVITLLGTAETLVDQFTVYADAGVTVTDACEGDLTASVVEVNPVDTSGIGAYTMTWNITDASGNAAVEVTRSVLVVDPVAPHVTSVTVLGSHRVQVIFSKAMSVDAEVATNYTVSGTGLGTLSLNPDSVLEIDPQTYELNWVCPKLMRNGGDITITVDAAVTDDAANPMSPPLGRTDSGGAVAAAPVITLLGASPVTVECGDVYTDAGATAVDECATDISAAITKMNPVDTAIVGSYTITYNVTDAAGNVAAPITRAVNVVDTTAPVIALLGLPAETVECGTVYADAGATALDNCDGDITAGIVTVNPVDTAIVGSYTITYNISDAAANAALEVIRTVDVVDTTAPVITLLGLPAETVECGNAYTDAGATAADVCGGDLTASIATVNPVDTGIVGSYTVTYNVSDAAANAALEVTRTVDVVDTTAPVIALLGLPAETVECGNAYADAGATALDNCDGDITASIVTVNPVNTAIVGSYMVTYNISDTAANAALEVTRTVEVVDTTAPVITLLGLPTETVECGAVYTDAGATALDNCDGDTTAGIVTVNPVDTGIVGSYTVTYNISDAAANAALEVTRAVDVVDTTAPVITLLGLPTETVECGAVYTDAGATALDNCDGDITAGIVTVNPVDTGIVGSYTVTYNISDAAANAALEVTRTVDVVDTTAPVITLLGLPTETVECGSTYTDAAATATDACDGDLTASIATVNPVDTGLVGSYTVTYNVSDAATNAALEVTRTVNVVDTTVPVLTLLGNPVVTTDVGAAYVDAGATASDICGGDLTGSIAVGGDTVDALTPVGAYTITYDVSDGVANAATQIQRTVYVVDPTQPYVDDVQVIDADTIRVIFSKAMSADAELAANYTVSGSGMGLLAATPDNVVEIDPLIYELNWICPSIMFDGGDITITVAGTVTDDALNLMTAPFARTDIGGAIAIAPTITLSGGNPVLVECGTAYTDAGATAVDACATVLTPSIVTVNPVIENLPGSYTITYDVVDAAGNAAAQLARTVNVVDATAPGISLLGTDPVTIECASVYVDAGATAADLCDGDITASLVMDDSAVNTTLSGSYTVTFDVTDAAGNAAVQAMRTVNVTDTVLPVISLVGADPIAVECGTVYADAGATAADVCDGDRTASIITTNPVNTSAAGTYTVRYNVTDLAGNAATEVTRTVNVEDTTSPTLALDTFLPADYDVDGYLLHECSTAFVEPAAFAALDACDGDLGAVQPVLLPDTPNVAAYAWALDGAGELLWIDFPTRVPNVQPYDGFISIPGDYLLYYVTQDTANNSYPPLNGDGLPDIYDGSGQGTFSLSFGVLDPAVDFARLVRVTDTDLPVITLLGGTPLVVECGTGYVDAGATAIDLCEGDLTAAIAVGGDVVDPNLVGSYLVTYNVTDLAGNAAIEVVRTVQVEDMVPPVITLVGADPLILECGGLITDPGATAFDVCEGDLTPAVVMSHNIDIAIPGPYQMWYDVTDGAGNVAVTVTRNVNVEDTLPPVLTIGVNWPFVPVYVNGFLVRMCDLPFAPDEPTDFGADDDCFGLLPPLVIPDKLPGLPGVFGMPGEPGIYAYAWHLDPAKNPLWVDFPGGTPLVRRYDDFHTAPTDDYLLIYVAQDDVGNTYPALDANGIPPLFDGAWNPTFQVGDVLLPGPDTFARLVRVADNDVPVITLVGADPLILECGGLITDPGATAFDVCEGDLTPAIVMSHNIDIAIPGPYQMWYDVTDGAGNVAVTVTRNVNVEDTLPPVLTIGVNWLFVPVYANGFLVRMCDLPFAPDEPTDFGADDDCFGLLPPLVIPDKLPGLPGVFGMPGEPGIYAYAWHLDPAKNPLWVDFPGGTPQVRRYDDFHTAPTDDYLLIYVAQDDVGNTYPALDANGIPPLFDGVWNPTFQVGDVLLPGPDTFARLVRVNCGKSNPSAFNIAFELNEHFEVYDIDGDGTLDQDELDAAYHVLHQIYPDLNQGDYNDMIDQLSNGTGTLSEVQLSVFVSAHDASCTPDETAPAALFQDITVELDEAGEASLFTEAAVYGTAAITYLYDNCLGDGEANLSAFTITASQDAFTCEDIGDVEVTITVSDGTNATTGTVTVTVKEGAATCPGRCGCMPGCYKGLSADGYKKMLADWLLIGLTLTCMFAFSATHRK